MKKLLLIILLALCTSCSITGPYTGTKYEIGYNNDDGVFIKAKPLVIDTVKDLFVE